LIVFLIALYPANINIGILGKILQLFLIVGIPKTDNF